MKKSRKSSAVKNKNPLPLIIVICLFVCLLFAFYNKDNKTVNIGNENDETVSASQNESSEDKGNNDHKENENEEEVFNSEPDKEKNDESKKEEEKPPLTLQTKKDTGLFLGMDDSNSIVLVTMGKDGKPFDSRFLIDRKLDFENSDIEIGDNVSFEYTVDSTDNKTIVKIQKQKQ